jgi:hypothetical protein
VSAACELSKWKESLHLDTLAAAHAECGQFDKAVELMRKVLPLGKPEHKDEFRRRLQLFREGKLWRAA